MIEVIFTEGNGKLQINKQKRKESMNKINIFKIERKSNPIL